jgi:metal-sulfur cluster biosynthetic enzyme
MMSDIQTTDTQLSDAPTPESQPVAPATPATEEDVLLALREVVDPEIGMDVIMLGLIREIDLKPDSSHVNMILTTPFCPYGPQLMEQVRRTVQTTTGQPTTIEMGLEMWDPSMMEEGAGEDWGLFY